MREYPRKVRINAQLQHELADLIRTELGDPRVKNVTVTSADVAPDLAQAKILVSVLGSDDELKDAVKGLNHASGKLRYELGKRLKLRVTPNLRFVADVALREGDRISALIRQAVSADQKQHKE